MKLVTHVAFAAALSMLATKLLAIPQPEFFILVAALSAMLPDIDQATSKIGRRFRPLSYLLKHRGAVHSLWAMFLVIVVIGLAVEPPLSLWLTLSVALGYGSHLLLDSLTPAGINYLCLHCSKKVSGPFRTGSLADYTILALSAVAIILMV